MKTPVRRIMPAPIFVVLTAMMLQCGRGPSIQFNGTEHDFGDIKPPVELTHVFRFKNTGGSTLKIIHIKPGCSCTAFLLSQKEIPPDGAGQLKVTVHAKKPEPRLEAPMRDSTYVLVFTNDPVRKKVALKLKVRVMP